MTPRILDYEDGKIIITPEAYMIPETNAIIHKYKDSNAEAYLGFVYMMSYPDTPYQHMSKEDRRESALFDVKQTMGAFDEDDELIEPAIERLKSLWTSPQTEAADELEAEVRRWVLYLRDTPTGGEEMKNRFMITDKFEKLSLSAVNLRKLADEEIRTKMKGSNELGEY